MMTTSTLFSTANKYLPTELLPGQLVDTSHLIAQDAALASFTFIIWIDPAQMSGDID